MSGLLAMLVTTALLVLAYPPNGVGWIACFALVPFFSVLQKQNSWRQAAKQGVLFGVLVAAGLLYFTWMIASAPWYLLLGASLAVTALIVVEGVILALTSWRLLHWALPETTGPRWQNTLRFVSTVILLGMLWAAVEWGIQKVFLGFSLHLGITQWRYPQVVRLARLIGLVGLSGVLAAVNCAVYFLGYRLRLKLSETKGWSTFITRMKQYPEAHTLIAGALVVVVIVVSAVQGARRPYGVWSTQPLSVVSASLAGTTIPVYTANETARVTKMQVLQDDPQTRYLDLVLIQNGFPLSVYEAAAESFSIMMQLYDQLLNHSQAGLNSNRLYHASRSESDAATDPMPATLLVWPETVLHIPVLNYANHSLDTYRLAHEAQTWILAGFPWADDEVWQNSAMLIDPAGQIQGRYSKVRPIPIAESWVIPGDGWYPLQMNDISVGVGLCSELIDPLASRTLTKNGAEVLVYLSSLSYLGQSSAIGLHGAFAPFRATETGRYVALSGTVGATLIAAPDGTISAALPSFDPGTLVGIVPALTVTTPFIRYGEVLMGLCFLVSLLCQINLTRTHSKSQQKSWSR